MKRKVFEGLAIITLLAIVIPFSACSRGIHIPSYLSVDVTQQPVGGYNVNKLSCVYTVSFTYPNGSLVNGEWRLNGVNEADPPDDVILTVVWYNDKGSKYNQEEIRFGVDEGDKNSGTFSTTWQTPSAGQVFDKTFWVRFSWEDGDGKHEFESARAVCNVR